MRSISWRCHNWPWWISGFKYSPRFAWGGRPHRRLFWPTQTYIQKIRQTHCFFQCFYNVFRRKHRNLRGFRHKVGPKQWFLQCFQGSGIKKVKCRDLPKPLKTPLFTLFSSIFPCANAAGQLKHIYKNRSKTLFFSSVFTFFSIKNAVIYTFFGLKVGPKHWFFAVFSMLWHPKTIQNIAIYSVFSFLSVFPLPEADQNDPKFRFNTLLSSDTQKSWKNTQTPPIRGLGAKSRLAPPKKCINVDSEI